MTPKERYYWYKSHGICTQCGQNDADEGHTLCLECRMAQREKGKQKLSTEQRYKHYQHQKRRREILIAFGICKICGKRTAREGYVTCEFCSKKYNNKQREKSHQKGVIPREILSDGSHCAICGATEIKEGYKVCEKCYPKLKENMLHARSCKKGENYFEKQVRRDWNFKCQKQKENMTV